MKVADAIAHTPESEGANAIFTFPVKPVIKAAVVADIRVIVVRQERIGLHMANACSRLSSGKKIDSFIMWQGLVRHAQTETTAALCRWQPAVSLCSQETIRHLSVRTAHRTP